MDWKSLEEEPVNSSWVKWKGWSKSLLVGRYCYCELAAQGTEDTVGLTLVGSISGTAQ